jgi:hypothetical protein
MRDDDTGYRIVIVSSRRRRRRREITTQRRRKARTDFDFDFSHSFERGSDRSETIHPRIRDGATYLEILGAKFKRSLFLRRHPSFVRSIRFDSNDDDERMDGCACQTEDKTVLESTNKDSENQTMGGKKRTPFSTRRQTNALERDIVFVANDATDLNERKGFVCLSSLVDPSRARGRKRDGPKDSQPKCARGG